MVIILDGTCMTDREAIHDHLAKQLELPDYYGRNLDALYDILTDRCEPMTVIVTHKNCLSDYGLRVMHTLQDAANTNPAIKYEEKDC